jgi:acetyltransferase
MLDAIRGKAILGPIRGEPAVDAAALVNLLVRASQLAVDVPEVVELDLNPVLASGDRCAVVDARILLAAPNEIVTTPVPRTARAGAGSRL